MVIVELQDVRKIYPLGKVEVEALKGVSFSIEKGDFISIAGPSGSGKTTILNMLGCVDRPTSGVVLINGRSTKDLSDKELTTLRHETLGFIFQAFNLIPVLSVYENIEFPLLLGKKGPKGKEKTEWIGYLIHEVGLDQWKAHKPNELSGGQRQRVAIARALINKPSIILADEPTGNLDSKTSVEIMALFDELQSRGNTIVLVTHEHDIAEFAHRIIHIRDGKVAGDEKTARAKS